MQPPQPMINPAERWQTLRLQALALLEQLKALAAEELPGHQPTWAEHTRTVDELVHFLATGNSELSVSRVKPTLSREQRVQFGQLLRDKRNGAGFSRVQLARKAKVSDATLKFLETARNPPSRSTLIRLIGVAELGLTWADVPGHTVAPIVARSQLAEPEVHGPRLQSELNCFLTPSYDPLAAVADLSRILEGAGGHVEQTNAYLDHYSAAAYLAICQSSIAALEIRARIPLAQAAKQILAAIGSSVLQVLALGAGDGVLEARLAGHLLDQQVSSVELCLLDISQPLLSTAYRHAVETLCCTSQARVWAVQCNFHHLPLYTQIYSTTDRRQRRLFCLLGGTLANLDHEPRFLRQSLLGCVAGDLLLLDIPTTSAPSDHPEDIKRLDKLYAGGVSQQAAAWLGGPVWRHCKEVTSVDFHWNLDTYCPVPGSYALLAMATVKSAKRADRQFSLFRFTRYNPLKLAECLSGFGWEEIAALPYGSQHSLRLYRKRDDGPQEVD